MKRRRTSEEEIETSMSKNANLVARSVDIHGESNFTLGCKFSPDGLCVLTSTASDNMLRLYNTPFPAVTALDDDGSRNLMKFDDDTTMKEPKGGSASQSKLPWKKVLSASAGDSVRSYSWYPLMNSQDPSTCAFLSVSRNQPIHLFDAYDSSIRASYRPYNALDEIESPLVVTFDPSGQRIFASGFRTDRTIHVFQTEIPGRQSDLLRLGKTRRSSDGQKGIVSDLSFPDDCTGMHGGGHVFAVGTYSPASIYIYDDRLPSDGNPAGTLMHGGICIVGHGSRHARKQTRYKHFHSAEEKDEEEEDMFAHAKIQWYHKRVRGGVTQLHWSKGGGAHTNNYSLFTASRRSDAIIQWDMRMLTGDASHPFLPLRAFPRDGDTNQRLQFDMDTHGKRLFVPGIDKSVKIYDITSGKLTDTIDCFDDVVNGVSFMTTNQFKGDSIDNFAKDGLLAVSTGARRFNHSYDVNEYGGNLTNDAIESQQTPGSLEIYSLENS